MKKILFISNLFPNNMDTERGVFNLQQIKSLSKLCEVKVVAPIAWFPFKGMVFPGINKIPYKENINGIEVYHPKVFYVPKICRVSYGIFYYLGILKCIKDIYKEHKFDLIYSSWAFPDGFGAMKIAKDLNLPFYLKIHGSDINNDTKHLFRRFLIRKVFQKAEGIIAVSNAIKKVAQKRTGVAADKISVVYNGIDRSEFSPGDKKNARSALGIGGHEGKNILYVGNLKETKGVGTLAEAMSSLKGKNFKLFIVGDGSFKKKLQDMIINMGLEEYVFLAGKRKHSEINLWIKATDVLCLPSFSEGLPNVILEAIASGRPVVATDVGGIREIFQDKIYGKLIKSSDPVLIKEALEEVLSGEWDEEEISLSITRFSWENNARILNELFFDE